MSGLLGVLRLFAAIRLYSIVRILLYASFVPPQPDAAVAFPMLTIE